MFKAANRITRHFLQIRKSSDCGGGAGGGGRPSLILGVYQDEDCKEVKFTPTGAKFDEESGGKLKQLTIGAGVKKGNARVFTNLSNEFPSIAVAGLGPEGLGWNDLEKLDECKENIRIATAHGARALQKEEVGSIFVEPFTNAEAAAESAYLSVWRYRDLKAKENQVKIPKVDLYGETDKEGWERGKIKANNQNFARKIEETPANLMTPTSVAELAVENLCPCGVNVEVRDKDWIEVKKMYGFLTIAKGSCEPPLFLEIGYCGGDSTAQPVVLVGKGITFDTGGLCLKKCENMSEYRGDLAGAAVVLAAIKCAAQMALPLSIIGLIPLCENAIGGTAAKPGDVVLTANGKSITIENTDNEGRVAVADALIYSAFRKPCGTVEVSTLTPGIRRCLGSSSSGTFSSSEEFWQLMERAGGETGDRLWRMPFWKVYQTSNLVCPGGGTLNNVGRGGVVAAVCKAAAFYLDFVQVNHFVHIDITGTGMLSNGVGSPYLREGIMTGRPTRTLVQFLYQVACPHTKGNDC